MQAFRTSVQRKYFIDKKIRDKTYPTATSLAKDYEKEFSKKIDPRTIATDISELRQIFKAPIKYDFKKRGYFYSDESFYLNVLEGETSGIPIGNISKNTLCEKTVPEWQQELLISFMNEVLPSLKAKILPSSDFSHTNITVLPSFADSAVSTNIEKLFLKAIKNNDILDVEVHLNEKNTERFNFLPLHLICQGESRLFFGKEFQKNNLEEERFGLLNLGAVFSANMLYSTVETKEKKKAIAENLNKEDAVRLYDINKTDESFEPKGSFYAQTTGNDDIEIIMTQDDKKHIFVFSSYASVLKEEKNRRYQKVGEFILNSLD